MKFDFEVVQDFSFCTLNPLTEEAKEWVKENIGEEKNTWFGAIFVEHRYIEEISVGILSAGLTIEKDGMEMIECDEELCLREIPNFLVAVQSELMVA